MRRLRTVAILAAILLGSACRQNTPEEDAPDRAMLEHARQVVRASMSATVEESAETADGRHVKRRVRRALPPPDVHPPRPLRAPARDDLLQEVGPLAGGAQVQALAIGNDGSLVYADRGATWRRAADGETSTVLDFGALCLQWNPDGTELVASGGGRGALLAWPQGRVLQSLDDIAPRGILLFSPDATAFWTVIDHVQFDASEKNRVGIEVKAWLRGNHEHLPGYFPPPGLAALGTFPQLRRAWCQKTQPYQVDPVPAPLWEAVDLSPANAFTDPGGSADCTPSADVLGNILFVRTPRRHGRHGRAHLLAAGAAPGQERLVSPLPADLAALSPAGTTLAITDGTNIFHGPLPPLLARDPAAIARDDQAFRVRANDALGRIRSAFASTPPGRTEHDGEFGREVDKAVEEDTLRLMDAALRGASTSCFGWKIRDGLDGIADLDELVANVSGLWPEEPATVCALGASLGARLGEAAQCTWDLQTATPELSNPENTVVLETGILQRFFQPFLAARLALSQGRPLLDQVRPITAAPTPHFVLVENLRGETVDIAIQKLSADLPEDQAARSRALLDGSATPWAAMQIWQDATAHDDRPLAALAALELAARVPHDARTLAEAGDALALHNQREAARLLLDQAVALSPDSIDIILLVARGYLDIADFNGALALYQRAKSMDTFGNHAEAIDSSIAMIEGILGSRRAR